MNAQEKRSLLVKQDVDTRHARGRISLPDLQRFEQTRIPLGVEFAEQLIQSSGAIACLVTEEETHAAQKYRHILNVSEDRFTIYSTSDPMTVSQTITNTDVIPIVINSAVDPHLKDMLFAQAGFGELLADSFPMIHGERSAGTPILHTVGITKHGIKQLDNHVSIGNVHVLEEKRSMRIRDVIGDVITPVMFHRLLQSDTVKEVHIHALGPEGTNISQASRLYAQRIGIAHKAHVIVYGAGITPLEYAQIAAEQQHHTGPEIMHLHVECAVYNNMGKLYETRVGESTFIDIQDMALDVMQLASNKSMRELQILSEKEGYIRIATHPSPQALVQPWLEEGSAQWIESSSNSAAALMVLHNESDACVTTASTVARIGEQKIQTLHEFGSPNMIFTIASPFGPHQLKHLLEEFV